MKYKNKLGFSIQSCTHVLNPNLEVKFWADFVVYVLWFAVHKLCLDIDAKQIIRQRQKNGLFKASNKDVFYRLSERLN